MSLLKCGVLRSGVWIGWCRERRESSWINEALTPTLLLSVRAAKSTAVPCSTVQYSTVQRHSEKEAAQELELCYLRLILASSTR
jgi:hypothetical protein